MKRFINAIEQSLKTKNWYSSVTLALTIPDICGWLENPAAKSQERYVKWFDDYLLPIYKQDSFGPDFAFLTGNDCYALRCSYLHQGSDNIADQKAQEVLSRFKFMTNGLHLIRIDDLLGLDVVRFCSEMCYAARVWLSKVADEADIQGRMKELIMIQESWVEPSRGIQIG